MTEQLVKAELIQRISDKKDALSQEEVSFGVNAILDNIMEYVEGNKKVEFRGFGTMERRNRNGRMSHDPRSGEKLYSTSKAVPFFKASKSFLAELNKGLHSEKDKEDSDSK